MSGVLSLTTYFYRWHPAVPWTIISGVALSIAAVVVNSEISSGGIEVHAIASVMLALGIICVGVPTFFAPSAFQNVLQNRHLALVPKLSTKLGTAAFIQTLMLSIAIAVAHGIQTADYITGFAWALTLTSLYFWVISWAIRQKALPLIVMSIVVAFSFVAVTLPMIEDTTLLHALIIFVAAPFCLLNWFRYILRLRPKQPIPDHDAVARNWANVVNEHIVKFNPTGAVLGYPLTWPQRLSVLGTSVLLVPLIMTLICAVILNVMATYNPTFDDKLNITQMLWITLVLCSGINAVLASNHSAIVARARMLWLKVDRHSLWHQLDRTMLANAATTSLFLAAIALVTYTQGLNATLAIASICATVWAGPYFSVAKRIAPRGVDWMLLVSFLALAVYAFITSNKLLAAIFVVGMIFLALYYRHRARQLVSTINWQHIRPTHRELDKRSMVSLW